MLKQLQGITLTQSERNRLSRDIKPKLEVIKQVAPFQDEFSMKKNQENKRIIQDTVETILKDHLHRNIQAILLFGSQIQGPITPRSDIDIAVLFSKIDLKEATKFRIRISGEVSEKCDIQVFNMLPQKLKKQIAKKHKVLFQKKEYDNTAYMLQHLKYQEFFKRKTEVFGET